MSDALTDIERDIKLAELKRIIEEKERQFLKTPSKQLAGELYCLWKSYTESPGGYGSSPDCLKAAERMAFYNDWTEGRGVELLRKYYDNDTMVLRIGEGFIVEPNIDSFILRTLYKTIEPVYHSKVAVKITVEPVGKITCNQCPYFGQHCHLGCESYVKEEYRERKNKVKGGQL
ncbi:MAG: hypothetical protein PWQ60_2274 [Thermoanaerobacteraceae bacterium]|nr:hypothetical protein [Thermoanaerobacteraceae bacterium]